jgi:hypothetical protein
MTDEQFQKYQQQRNAIIKEFNGKALKTVGIAAVCGGGAVAIFMVVFALILHQLPVGIILSLISGLFALIYGWMRTLMIKNAKEKKLQEFEDHSLLNRNY